jgi:hypothetical protein
LMLSDYADRGILISEGGLVAIDEIDINGGNIDNVTIGETVPVVGYFSTIDINGGSIDNTIIGADLPASGKFTTVDINGGFIDNTRIGLNTPQSGDFTGIIADVGNIGDLSTNVLYTDNLSFGYLDPGPGLAGDWICDGSFTLDNIKLDGNLIVALDDFGLGIYDNDSKGITIHDGGFITIGDEDTKHRRLTIIDTAPQLRLQYDESNHFEFSVGPTGDLLLTGTGAGTKIYSLQDLDMQNSTITGIGSEGSYFSSAGDLTINGYCSLEELRMGSDIVLRMLSDNTFFGVNAGLNYSTGDGNTLFGKNAAYSMLTGEFNTIIGYDAAYTLNTGTYNVIMGPSAGFHTTVEDSNILVGYQAGLNVGGNNNVYIGHQAGYNNQGSDNVFIGYQSGYDTTYTTESLYIANQPGMPLIFGSFSLNRIGLQTIDPQYTLDVQGDIRVTNFLGFGGDSFTSSASATFSWDVTDDDNLELIINGDNIGLTTWWNETISTGAGTIKMCGSTPRESTGFLKIYINGYPRYIPYYTTIDG